MPRKPTHGARIETGLLAPPTRQQQLEQPRLQYALDLVVHVRIASTAARPPGRANSADNASPATSAAEITGWSRFRRLISPAAGSEAIFTNHLSLANPYPVRNAFEFARVPGFSGNTRK